VTKNLHPELKAGRELEKEAVDAVERLCREMAALMKLELKIAARSEGETVQINMSGPDRPMLLANTATLLNCMEYLLNKAFRTGKDEEIASILLDSEQYRMQREAELKLLAQIASKKVISQGRALALQPMTPRDRRIVHLALAEIEGVRSQSDGEGDQRSITIYPAG
jgi:spoIIIJ-associated protein